MRLEAIELMQGDLTTLEVDAIVNAANSHLQHGGGLAGAIVRRGGEEIQRESNGVGYVPVGSAAVTGAGKLPARHIIHAVGPRMGEGDEDAKLRNATLAGFQKGEELGVKSIGYPAISTGIFGYPIERCAPIMLGAVAESLHSARSVERVVFCLFDRAALDVFSQAMEELRRG